MWIGLLGAELPTSPLILILSKKKKKKKSQKLTFKQKTKKKEKKKKRKKEEEGMKKLKGEKKNVVLIKDTLKRHALGLGYCMGKN